MEELIKTIPLIIAIVVPPLLTLVRTYIHQIVPDRYIPVLLPVAGALAAALANLTGIDAAALQQTSTDPDVWQTIVVGIVTGLAANGVHQIKVQAKKE